MSTSVATLESAYRDAREAQRAAGVRKDDALKSLNGELSLDKRNKPVYTVAPAKDRDRAKKAFQDASAAYARASRTANLAREALVRAGGDPLAVDGVARTATPAAPARPNGSTRAEAPYTPQERSFSFFADLRSAATGHSEARERLETNQKIVIETRQSGYTAGEGFMPPAFMSDAWAALPKQANVLREAFTEIPMPETGLEGYVPRVTAANWVTRQTDPDSGPGGRSTYVENTDPNSDVQDYDAGQLVTDAVESQLGVIVAKIDVDRQIAQRIPGLDLPLAMELVDAVYSQLDYEQMNGLGNAYELKGLLNASGSYTLTDDSGTTGVDLLNDIYKVKSQVYRVRFRQPTHIVMHSRRYDWLSATEASTFPLFQQGDPSVPSLAGMRVIVSNSIPENLPAGGTGTDEDAVVLLVGGDVYHAESEVRFKFNQVASGSLGLRYEALLYAYLWAERRPEGIGLVKGSVLSTPSGF